MKLPGSKLLLGLALGVTILLAAFAPPKKQGTGVVASVAPARVTDRSKSNAPELHVLALRSRDDFGTSGDAFPVEQRPVLPTPIVMPPTELSAPPSPFTVIGKERQLDSWAVFLSRGDDVFVARPNSTIDETYRVESISPPKMTVTYLPQQTTQTIDIGDAD